MCAITNFAYVFDTNGDTTPPALTLLWPQDGTQVSGNSFTVQAWMDDDTATVALQYTDSEDLADDEWAGRARRQCMGRRACRWLREPTS